jgi:hypothetical protein
LVSERAGIAGGFDGCGGGGGAEKVLLLVKGLGEVLTMVAIDSMEGAAMVGIVVTGDREGLGADRVEIVSVLICISSVDSCCCCCCCC